MPLAFHNRFSKGLQNKGDTTINHTFWKTSFNMPVKALFSGATYTQTEGFINAFGVATSFDMTGFQAGWEAVCADTVFDFTGPFGGGTVNISQTWKKPDGTVTFTNGPVAVSIPALSAGSWFFYQLASNQGHAEWEISTSGTYTLTASATGAITQSQDFTVSFTNVPSITSYTTGMVWVEGSDLRWTSANGHIHTTYGILNSYVGTTYAGAWWVNSTTNMIEWIGNDGNKYISKYNFQQFDSYFSGGPYPGVISGQSPGYAWMDSNFGYEHIGYIGNDGYKWIFPSGANPYSNPPASTNP